MDRIFCTFVRPKYSVAILSNSIGDSLSAKLLNSWSLSGLCSSIVQSVLPVNNRHDTYVDTDRQAWYYQDRQTDRQR